MRVADFVIEYLLSKKIKTFFSVTGRGSLFLNDALAKSKKAKYFLDIGKIIYTVLSWKNI